VTPLAGVYVRISTPESWGGESSTAADGSYEITGIPAGNYNVVFLPPWGAGYAFEYYNNTVILAAASVLSVTPGGELGGIDATLQVGGTISGTLTDQYDQPPAWATVTPLLWVGSEWVELPDIKAWAGPDGSYTIDGLPAGSYILLFESPRYQNVYYGGSADPAGATVIPVSGGDNVTGKDVTLTLAPTWVDVSDFRRTGPGAFTLSFDGTPDMLFQLQKSGNLNAWTNVGTPVTAVPDYWQYDGFVGTNSIPVTTSAPKEFWRLIEAGP
jgi:hypothetical protein